MSGKPYTEEEIRLVELETADSPDAKAELHIDGMVFGVGVLRLQPGDEIVISTQARLSVDAVRQIKEAAEKAWPDHRVAILSEMSLSIVRS